MPVERMKSESRKRLDGEFHPITLVTKGEAETLLKDALKAGANSTTVVCKCPNREWQFPLDKSNYGLIFAQVSTLINMGGVNKLEVRHG